MKVKQYDVLLRGRKVTYTLESPLKQHVLVAKTSLAPSYWHLDCFWVTREYPYRTFKVSDINTIGGT
jgi:hypothetical protein